MRKKKDQPEGGFAEPQPVARLTPMDVQQKEFGVMRVGGGYRMRDVDEFLDEVTNSMSALVEENRRLREQVGSGAMIGAPDLDEVARQADEIIHRAREEAARIIFEARAPQSAAAPPAAVTAGDRAAISAFLGREREFLQSLAGLVQGHAEAVKGMARDARDAAAAGTTAVPPTASGAGTSSGATTSPASAPHPSSATAPAAPTTAEAAVPPTEGAGSGSVVASPVDESSDPSSDEPSPPAPREERAAPDVVVTSDSADRPTEAMDEPVRIDEPEPAKVGRAESEETQEEGDRSLRELFWGED